MRSVAQFEPPPSGGHLRPVSVGSVSHEDEGVRLIYPRLGYAWGKFSDEDQANIKGSLADTLLAATRKSGPPIGEPIKVHVLIRKYYVEGSNSAAAIFAGVDWVAAEQTNQLLFQESFYATSKGHFPQLFTLGSLKDAVNSAIIKRIAQKAITLAAGGHPESINVEGTYSTFDGAAASMPEILKSSDIFVAGGPPVKVELEGAEMKTPVDWKSHLANAVPNNVQIEKGPPALPPDKGRIWLYRTTPKLLGVSPFIDMDGKSTHEQATPRYAYYYDVSPGTHEVGVDYNKLVVTVEKGQQVFVRFDVDPKLLGKGIYPVLVDQKTGQDELKRYKGIDTESTR